MNNHNISKGSELPSMGKLVKSTILAICIATIILVTVVLPAEYGIDPTGVGKLTGLVKMGEIKASLEEDASMEKIEKADSITNIPENTKTDIDNGETISSIKTNSRNDKITLELKPNEGKEIKFTMSKGATVNYIWYTDGGKANFDAHADSKKLKIKYHNYEKGKLEKSEGVMEAVFDGNHGWFWRNRTSETMKVTLEVKGNYTNVLQF